MMALLVIGGLALALARALPETGDPTYHGKLEGVLLPNGRYRPVRQVALGSAEGLGLVTADSAAAVRQGELLPRPRGGYQKVKAVYYRRSRPGGSRWVHELNSTAYAEGPHGPVFRSLSSGEPARVCAWPPGEFICEG